MKVEKKKTKSTQSSRRHAFASFRERIDSVKIDPNMSLSKRLYDDAEVSHFMSSMEHWKEINISGNFTDFLDQVENKCQSLAQMLHHQQFIFDALYKHIEVNDVYSVQPLLELLAQFAHDLGPDFLAAYYRRTLDLIMMLALSTDPNDLQNSRNASNVLEWGFNALAFIFKYLSKLLAADILPTFHALLPLLRLPTKRYIARYCAEALSFLIRKLRENALANIIQESLNVQLLEEPYCQLLTIMYSESMKSTNGVFHTKALQIFAGLLDNGLQQNSPRHILILSDIILSLLNHGTTEACNRFYQSSTAYMTQLLECPQRTNPNELVSISQVLLTLAFAESGKKITSWQPVLSTLQRFLDHVANGETTSAVEATLVDLLVYLLAVIFRNCSIDELTRFQNRAFEAVRKLDGGKAFFKFVETSMELCPARMKNFAVSKRIQNFVDSMNEDDGDLMCLALFLSSRKEHTQGLIIPRRIQDHIQHNLHLHNTSLRDPGANVDIYWRLVLLRYTSAPNQTEAHYRYLMGLLHDLSSVPGAISKFQQDIAATAFELLLLQAESHLPLTLSVGLDNFYKLGDSPIFLDAFTKLVTTLQKSAESSHVELLERLDKGFLQRITINLKSSNHDTRYNTIKLLIQLLGDSAPQIVLTARIIEEIPLTLATGRDLSLRIRCIGGEYKALIKPTDFDRNFITNFLFGLLTNKFQPCWLAVSEVLPMILSTSSAEIWRLAEFFVNLNYAAQNLAYTPVSHDSFDNGIDLVAWLPDDSRLSGNFSHINRTCLTKFANVATSLVAHAEIVRGEFCYSEIMRWHALQALAAVPQVAESHSDVLVPLILHKLDVEEGDEDEDGDVNVKSAAVWSLKDRNALVTLLCKFQNLKRVHKSDELFQHMLKLLCNKQVQVQKMALDVVLSWKIGTLNKYRDNLQNLLDNTLFKDEIAKFLSKDTTTNQIEDLDLDVLMPIILRILFGRAQSSPKSNSQAGRKFAVVTVLPNLTSAHITEFLRLGSDRIGYNEYLDKGGRPGDINPSVTTMRRINGYVKLLSDVIGVLGLKYKDVLATSVKPLIYALVVAQHQILSHQSDDEPEDIIDKSARNVRLVGTKCLGDMFNLLGESYEWSDEDVDDIYRNIIHPRLGKFAQENLQQTSSLMRMMCGWINYANLMKLYYLDNYAPVEALLLLLENDNCKEAVVLTILDFVQIALNKNLTDSRYISLMAQTVNSLLKTLPSILDRSTNNDVNTKGVDILLLLLEQGYINDNETMGFLIDSLTRALDKPHAQLSPRNKVNILKSLSALVDTFDCTFDTLKTLYHSCSKSLRIYKERNIRSTLVAVFQSFAKKFSEVAVVGDLLEGLNAYSNRRLEEPDFDKRLPAFRKINEELYLTLNTTQWTPILNCALHFINDDLELAIRTNSTFILNRYVDAFSLKPSAEDAKEYVHVFKDTVLPNIRTGLRKFSQNEVVQTEYISVLAHTVQQLKYFCDLDDMKVLLFNNDEEANFFANVNHIQLHRRQRAIKRLREYKFQLTENSISHYILPIIEHYAFCTDDDKLRNIANETVDCISDLAKAVSWNQFRALFRRYVSNLRKSKPEELRDHVSLIVAVAKSLKRIDDEQVRNLPSSQAELDSYVIDELFPPISKVLNVRDDETIVSRIRLSEALTNLVTCVSSDKIESMLPGILTSTCQVIRSRSEELRDAVRKSLGRISSALGPKYFKFILQELKTSLSRGSQIHVLSFTVHSLLVNIQPSLAHGDLDECCELIVNIIMEDVFGAAGQEKDAEGYTSKMKEVKFNKSFDSGEILSANISLVCFKSLVLPVKSLLQENVTLKIQNKLEELLRRYALGLNHNEEASDQAILNLCYELNQQSTDIMNKRNTHPKGNQSKGAHSNANHFLVKLNAKPQRTQVEYASYIATLQKFSFDLLRTAISRHATLLDASKMEGFMPLIAAGLDLPNEGVIISSLRVLNLIVRLQFTEETENELKTFARKLLSFIKDCPSTNSELCQASLRFLAIVVRHKPGIRLKDTAISYVLLRIQPDLEEPNRQGLAFSFLKAILSQHIMIPEVYDTMDKVSKIMIVNHSKEIRDMARSAYFQFLMEYDQGRGRLEKQFKFLLNNLTYPTQDGRLSVMELLHLIILKAGPELLEKLASSFFLGLASVVVSDDHSKCREMAATLLSAMFKKLGSANMQSMEKYCVSWLKQSDNRLLQRCGLQIYKLYVSEFGFGNNDSLDVAALKRVEEILGSSKSSDDEDTTVDWELVYSALSVFSTLSSNLKELVFSERFSKYWRLVLDTLLYPHSWVRLITCRLVGMLLSNLSQSQIGLTGYEVQTVAYRLLHQLGAPSIAEALGTQIVKNLVVIAMKWEQEKTKYEFRQKDGFMADDASHGDEQEARYKYAIDYLVARISAIMRQENNYKDSFVSKKSCVQLAALMVQIISVEDLPPAAERLMLGMYNFSDLDPNNSEGESVLYNLTAECNLMIESKLGVSDYARIYTQVKQIVNKRRQDRRTKRAQLNITAPDVAAKRKMRKHERFREKRKHEKDENGYYRSKRNKFA